MRGWVVWYLNNHIKTAIQNQRIFTYLALKLQAAVYTYITVTAHEDF